MDLKAIATQKAAEILSGKRELPSLAQKISETSKPVEPKPGQAEPSDDEIAREAVGSKLLSAFETKDPRKLTHALIDALEVLGISVEGSSSDKES